MKKVNKTVSMDRAFDIIKKPITTGKNLRGPSITSTTVSSIVVFDFNTILLNLLKHVKNIRFL